MESLDDEVFMGYPDLLYQSDNYEESPGILRNLQA